MANQENFRINDLFGQINKDGGYDAALIGAGLHEIHKSGKYRTMFIPERVSLPPSRSIQLVQMSSFFPNGELGLLEFIPETSFEQEETLRRIIDQQVNALYIEDELGQAEVERAVKALKEQRLMIAGAFEIGTLNDGTRSMEIIYPLPYLEITHSVQLSVALAASFVRFSTSQ